MLHAFRNHLKAFATNDPEVGVVIDDDGVAIIHAMRARPKFLKGWWTR